MTLDGRNFNRQSCDTLMVVDTVTSVEHTWSSGTVEGWLKLDASNTVAVISGELRSNRTGAGVLGMYKVASLEHADYIIVKARMRRNTATGTAYGRLRLVDTTTNTVVWKDSVVVGTTNVNYSSSIGIIPAGVYRFEIERRNNAATQFFIDNVLLAYVDTSTVVDCEGGRKDYRYGFNGMEKDSEIKGEGNSYDFGARLYDNRLGRWLTIDRLKKVRPYSSPFLFGLNSPVMFLDQDGNIDYFAPDGDWIGTDGTTNKGSVVVTDKTLRDNIIKGTKEGLNYTNEIPETQKYALPDNKVLKESLNVLGKTGESGMVEYMKILKKNDKGEFEVVYDKKGSGLDAEGKVSRVGVSEEFPEGDVNIHSHPTAVIKYSNGQYGYFDALEPSPGYDQDKGVFQDYELNIIVGRGGVFDAESYKTTHMDNRTFVVAFYDKHAKSLYSMTVKAIQKILDTKNKDDSKLYKKYSKAQSKKKVTQSETTKPSTEG